MSLAELLGEEFLSSDECVRALTHRSVSSKNNERLEYLGGSLLGFFIANWLFNHFPTYPEGDLTRIRAHLVKKDTLAEIAREHNLAKHLVLGAGELKSGGLRSSSILADALEGRFERIPTVDQLKDAKTRLQELLQSNGENLPVYDLVEKHGKSGNETFSVQCLIENCQEIFVGMGTSRRKAEQEAAGLAFEFISKKISP